MKIQDFLNQQKQIKTSDAQKMRIYQAILLGGNKKSFFSKSLFYWKISTYTVLLVFLWGVFFGPILQIGEKESEIDYSYLSGGFLVEEKLDYTLNEVLADYIGEIIEVEGEIQVLKDGKVVKTDKIYNGDTILLLNTAQITFMVNNGSQATIIGPAKFDVRYIGENNGTKSFIINLIYGDYFELKTQNESKDNIIIQTQDFQIESKDISKKIDLKITTSGDKKIVENRGADIVLKKVIDEEKTFTDVRSNEVAEVNEEVKILKEIKDLTQQLSQKEVIESYNITTNLTGNIEDTIEEVETISSNLDDSYRSDNLTGNIIDIIKDEKKILDTAKSDQLKLILHPTFLKRDLNNLILEYLKGNQNSFEISYLALYSRIENVYNLFGFKIHSELIKYSNKPGKNSISDLLLITDQLISKLDNQYHISNTYLGRLKKVLAWLVVLNNKEFGLLSKDKDTLEFEQIFDKLNLQKSKDNLEIK